MNTQKILSLGFALATLVATQPASAAVTSKAWYRMGDGGLSIQTDVAGGHNFSAVYFQNGIAPLITPNAVGGVLGASGVTSTNCARFGLNGIVEYFRSGVNSGPGTPFSGLPQGTNYGVECWFMPQNQGYISDGSQIAFTPIFSCGGSVFGNVNSGGGLTVVVVDNFDGTSSLQAAVVAPGDSASAYHYFGPSIPIDTNNWIHLAIVNDNSLVTFYTNGVVCATNDNNSNPLFPPGGSLFIGRDGGHVGLDGFLDECRVFEFTPGGFSTNDLLFKPSPRVIGDPIGTTVWNGGAANISANISTDTANTYQWYQGSTLLSGQTLANLNLNTVALGDSGNLYKCAATNNGIGLVTSNATLTVVAAQTANAAAYQSAVTGTAGLVAYFPADGSTTTTVANTVDGSHNGTLQAGALYDGQTNRAFGTRAIYLRENGDVKIPSNSAYEFAANGTIEALVYLQRTLNGGPATLFSVASDDGSGIRYSFSIAGDGSSLICTNDAGVNLTWPAGVNLLNRFAHVAFVFSGGTSVTAYRDGVSLGTLTQSGFGSATGVPAWIGSVGTNTAKMWNGTVDELAIYSSALSAATIASHNSKFIFGTNANPPVIVSQSSNATIYAGGSPVLTVSVTGGAPLNYQWRSNGVSLAGATSSSLTLAQITTGASGAAFTVTVTNGFGSITSSPIVLTVTAPPSGYAAAVMADNPTAFWRLNESSGTTMTDYVGGLNGVYSGAYALGAAGIEATDTATTFTGGQGEVAYTPVLNPSRPFTVEFWAKPSGTGAQTPIASQYRISGRLGYAIYNNNGSPGFRVNMGNFSGATVDVIGTIPVTPGNWYHCALTYDGGSNAKLYVFGYLDGQSANAGGGNFLPNPSEPFEIGIRNQGGVPFNGVLDEVAFYNYELTQTQLQSHVTIGLPLKLAIGTATNVIADSKPNNPAYNGVLNNPAYWQASNSDGSTARNGVMQFAATNGAMITVPPYSAFTTTNGAIMFWMRSAGTFTSIGDEAAIIFDRRGDSGGGGMVFFQNDSGVIGAQTSGGCCNFSSTISVSDNLWHHIAFVYDSTPFGSVTLYIDGVADVTKFNNCDWSWLATQRLEIGQSHDGYWRIYNGLLDDFRIYDRILSAAEVVQAKNGAVVDAAALQARFDFDGPPNGYAVSYPYGSLLRATNAAGPYTVITNAPLPFPVVPKGTNQEFFRGLR